MAESEEQSQTALKNPDDAAAMAAEIDVGARDPANWQGKLIACIALVWSLFQLYYASNIPFLLTELTRKRGKGKKKRKRDHPLEGS